MSPEQGAGSRELDGRSDLYSLGCVLYEMLAGHPPFIGATAQEVLARHSMDVVPRLTAARGKVPAPIEEAVEKALAKTPADRYRTAQEFSDGLFALRRAGGPRSDGETVRRRWIALALGGFLVLAVATGVVKYVAPTALWQQPAVRSITVLPVSSLAADSSSAAVAQGLTLALNTQLGQLRGIEVKGHSSAARYRSGERSYPEIAREMGVDAVLYTTFLRDQDRSTPDRSPFATGSQRWKGDR